MIIGSKELRDDARAVVIRVLKFLGLHEDATWLPDNPHELSTLIQHQFPTFEKTTAWRLNSDYEPLSTDMRTFAEEFFTNMNSLLFEQLGTNYTSMW